MRMIALAALSANDESAFEVVSDGAAHDAEVLLEHEVVLNGRADHLVVVLYVFLHSRLRLRTLQGRQTGLSPRLSFLSS